ncbi:UNVERIFIED_CONTAM: hypothetical protein RMT77_011151 [Armadillidium vulgare]
MKVAVLLIFSFLFFESARCDAGHAVPQPIPLPQPFPLDSSAAFPIDTSFTLQFNQQNPLSILPNFCNVKGSVLVGNKCLLIERTALSWEESNRYCSQIGFKLLEILGGEEYFNLISFLRAKGLLSNSYWIGAAKRFNNIWTWVSQGLPIHNTFWAVTFLNGKGVKEPISQLTRYASSDCGELSKSRSHFIKAEQCSTRNSFICEKSFNTRPQFLPPSANPWFVKPHFLDGEDDTAALECPVGWTHSDTQLKCYLLVKDVEVTFSDAKTNCEGVSSTLVAINSPEENAVLQDISGSDSGYVYIGLFSDAAGSFEWVTNEPVTYTNWGSGEPATASMSCGSFNLDTGEWKDNSCQDLQGYICEAEPLVERDDPYQVEYAK